MPGHASDFDADLLIAGAGSAGLAAAIFAAQSGLSCVVVDPHEGAQDKACGEGLMPAAVDLLAAMDVTLPRAHRIVGIRYVQGEVDAVARFERGEGIGLRRTELSAALKGRAEALGVRFLHGKISALRCDADGVVACGVRARWLLGCDGLRSTVRRLAGIETREWGPSRFGVRRHYRVRESGELVEIHWGSDFEIYVTPVARDVVNVAALFRSGATFASCIDRMPELRRTFVEPVSAPRGGGPFARRASRLHQGRVLLVGDAAGFLDPITGEGNRLAMASAKLAIECLVREEVHDYERRWLALTRGYRVLTRGLLWAASSPRWRRFVVPGARAFPPLFSRALRVLS